MIFISKKNQKINENIFIHAVVLHCISTFNNIFFRFNDFFSTQFSEITSTLYCCHFLSKLIVKFCYIKVCLQITYKIKFHSHEFNQLTFYCDDFTMTQIV